MSKRKILLGFLVAAGAVFAACKILKPRIKYAAVDDAKNSDDSVDTLEQKDTNKASVDIEDVVAYVTQPVENKIPEEKTGSDDSAAQDAVQISEEDFEVDLA